MLRRAIRISGNLLCNATSFRAFSYTRDFLKLRRVVDSASNLGFCFGRMVYNKGTYTRGARIPGPVEKQAAPTVVLAWISAASCFLDQAPGAHL